MRWVFVLAEPQRKPNDVRHQTGIARLFALLFGIISL
jgi:hypothetical protein